MRGSTTRWSTACALRCAPSKRSRSRLGVQGARWVLEFSASWACGCRRRLVCGSALLPGVCRQAGGYAVHVRLQRVTPRQTDMCGCTCVARACLCVLGWRRGRAPGARARSWRLPGAAGHADEPVHLHLAHQHPHVLPHLVRVPAHHVRLPHWRQAARQVRSSSGKSLFCNLRACGRGHGTDRGRSGAGSGALACCPAHVQRACRCAGQPNPNPMRLQRRRARPAGSLAARSWS